MSSETYLASFGLIGVRLLERHGIDTAQFLRRAGLPKVPISASTRLPSDFLDRAFALGHELFPTPAFALEAADCWHPSHLGTLGYAWLSSGSLRTALTRMARYTRILGQRKSSRCLVTPEGLRFEYDHGRGDTAIGYVMADFDLAIVMSMCRMNVGGSVVPDSVSLRRPQPADSRPYEQFFGCPVGFGATHDSFVLAHPLAEARLPTSNHELAITFDAILNRQLQALGGSDLLARAKAFLLQELTSGEPSEADLSRFMCMSSRTLQRKLGAYDHTYRSLLESVRYELALRYLEDPGKTVTDITFLLGFAEQSSFSRAFKRWSGKSPSAWRDNQHITA
jgi:AraC-like DNA-binding protein